MLPERTAGGFGGRLRDARERRGVSLRQIANATKISVAVLDALERNDIAKLPGGIFGRAFVRSYAIEVGLDPEATIHEFIAQFPNDSVIAGHPTSDQIEDYVAVEGERRTAGTFLSLVAVSVPIVAGLLYFATSGRRADQAPVAPPAAASPAELAAAAAQPSPLPPAVTEPMPAPATIGAATPAAAAAVIEAAVPAPQSDASPAALPGPGEVLTVALAVKRPCWISATVDGQKTIERLLQAGEQQTIAVRKEIVLTAGDASAIALQFNGADARLLGKAGEVVTARFNLTNYKDYLQAR
ncbi:MAG: helix-turn-helix domain-containing protein [Vicinamibacterales bacterium]